MTRLKRLAEKMVEAKKMLLMLSPTWMVLQEMGRPRVVPMFDKMGEAGHSQFFHITSKNLCSQYDGSAK